MDERDRQIRRWFDDDLRVFSGCIAEDVLSYVSFFVSILTFNK